MFTILFYLMYSSNTSIALFARASFFNFLFLPISKLSFKINSLLRYHPLYLTVEHKTFKIVSSRGFDYYYSNIINRALLFTRVRSSIKKQMKRKNKEIAFYQELKLFSTKKYRTNYSTNKVGFNDIFFLLFHLCLIYAYLVDGGLIWDI